MSTIDNGSHEGFYFTEDEDTNYPDWQPVHGGSGREEYGSESSSEDDLDNDQLAEDFSSLELEQRMRSRRRSSKHARGGGTNHRIASAEAKECRQGGVVSPEERYTSTQIRIRRVVDPPPHYIKHTGAVE
jgi:hypothetical protein